MTRSLRSLKTARLGCAPLRDPAVSGSSASTDDYAEAQERANLCEGFLSHLRDGYSANQASKLVGKSASYFSGENSMLARYQRGGVEALIERRKPAAAPLGELSKAIEALPWFIPAAQLFYLYSNRSQGCGSVPEAVRRTLSLPAVPVGWKKAEIRRLMKAIGAEPSSLTASTRQGYEDLPACPVEIREACLAREKAGQQLVPQRIARKITVNRATVDMYRNPREAGLDYLCAPGGMRLVTDHGVEGGQRLARAGEIIEGDDATVNFPVCVPWERDGSDDPCVQKYGVKVARFQWLVTVDVGTSFVTGFSYTARPKSSYRAEDIVSLMKMVCRAHGVPRQWRFERGAWESKLVKSAIARMGSRLDTVYSPHCKPFIEGLFNVLWTKLSVHFPGGHVGRFMGEEREANLLLAACQAGHKDPRKYFPMLKTAIAAFQEVIAEKNRTPVNTDGHGRWIPEERWEREQSEHLRPMHAETEWMFSPFVRRWPVRGMLVGGRVPMFEKISVPFDFSAPWLTNYHGARVDCHFDPADPRCGAMVVLAERWNHQPAGTVLGMANQVNQTAGYVRLVMGWGDDPATDGLRARQQARAQMRREVRAVLPRGQRQAPAESELRDGLGSVTKVEVDGAAEKAAERVSERVSDSGDEIADRVKESEKFLEGNPLEFI